MARPAAPEPKFFLVDALYEKGIEHYSRTWFADIGSARISGEKSTDYLESAVAASRIARDLPGAKLVFVLREPVDRAYSNYLWSRMNGLETETFEAALALEEQREGELPERFRFTRPYSYFSRGLYADLLQPYLNRFPREQCLILKFEDLVARPGHLVARLHRFLGVAERPGDADGLGVVNASEKSAGGLRAESRRELARRYAGPNQRLRELLGSEFDAWS